MKSVIYQVTATYQKKYYSLIMVTYKIFKQTGLRSCDQQHNTHPHKHTSTCTQSYVYTNKRNMIQERNMWM